MKTIIIDGYNVIHAIPELYEIFLRDMQKAREYLVRKLSNTQTIHSFNCTVVFDSKEASLHIQKATEPIRIIFSYPEGTADEVIVNLVKEANSPKSITVISDDKALGANCKYQGAHVASPKQFWYSYVVETKHHRTISPEKPEITNEEDIAFWENYFKHNEDK